MNRSQPFVVVVLLIGLFLIGSSVYTVSEVNQAIITQFGEPVGEPVIEPGLHFKLPFIQRANMFEKRFLEWDGFPNQVPTRDRRFIWVDTYARWRITDPLLFFQRLRDERGAQSRLDDILDGETRNAVARHDLIEIVRSTTREPVNTSTTGNEEAEVLDAIATGRQQITEEILEAAGSAVAERLWSPARFNHATEAFPRLATFRCHMVRRGVSAANLHPGSCWSIREIN